MIKIIYCLIIATEKYLNFYMFRKPAKIIITFFLLISNSHSYAQDPYLITNNSPIAVNQSSLKGLEWIDKTGKLSNEKIVENINNFSNAELEKSNQNENHWQLFLLSNNKNENVLIDIGMRPNRNAIFFALINNEIIEVTNKTFYTNNLYSSLNLFTDEANINNSRRMLFKIPANTSAKVFIANGHNVSFRDGQKYPEWSRGILYIEGILLGALIPLLFSSIYYSFLFKDKANIWFSIYLFFTIIFTFIEPNHDGSRFGEFINKSEVYGNEAFLNSTNFFQNLLDWHFVYLGVLFYIFCLHALRIQNNYKLIYKIILAILIGRALSVPVYFLSETYENFAAILNFIDPVSSFISRIINIADIPLAIIFIFISIVQIRNNVKSANFMVASIIVYFFGVFGLHFISVKLRGSYFDHSNLLTLLTVVQNILIWFSLIRTSKDNQAKAIEVIETHNKFIAQQNQTLEVKVKERTHELHLESQKSERLMLNILPESIASRLKAGDESISDSYQNATILFSDLVGFTKMSSGKTAEELVFLLNDLFKRFDTRATSLGLEKIKTIGDAYMVAGGLPTQDDTHAIQVTKMALGMYEDLDAFNKEHGMELGMRIGINSGPVVAGVIGHSKFSYDLWGNTVNTASRMESTCLPGKVQVSPSTYEQIKGHFDVQENQVIECKGLGQIMTYFVK